MTNILFDGPRNIFANYGQAENNFTNGLFSILEFSACQDPQFPVQFFRKLLGVDFPEGIESFKVLREIKTKCQDKKMGNPTVDGEITGGNVSLFFETKIYSYSLGRDQIERHLKTAIEPCTSKVKKLVLLTPDDKDSEFLKEKVAADPKFIMHLKWMDVCEYLKSQSATWQGQLLGKLIEEYLAVVNQTIERQDFIGIIQKVVFNKTTELRDQNDCIKGLITSGDGWGLPKKRNELDGKGRKLLLYSSEPKAIFCEAEVIGCEVDKDGSPKFSCRYKIKPDSVVEFVPPIPLARIEKLLNFEKFGTWRTAYPNLLRIQYEQLTAGVTRRAIRSC